MIFADKIIIEGKEGKVELQTKVISKVAELRPLLNPDCWRIFEKLIEKPAFPAEISKELGINEQKVYYYIKQLKNSNLISIEKTEERNGALAKYYSASADSFAIVPNQNIIEKKSKILKRDNFESEATEFLNDFTKKGIFSAKIVVGSPDPHGIYKARARDGHLAAELTAFLGANTQGFELPLVFLDTMVKDLKNENSNLIILGGPVTNKLAEQVNNYLPIKFVPSGGNWSLSSKPSGKEYNEDSIGVIEKIPHPYFKGKWVMILAGKRNTGTITAILA
ncbi:MAG: S-layer protein, partial [archaeon]|nr:S-layer protein [archaeon]